VVAHAAAAANAAAYAAALSEMADKIRKVFPIVPEIKVAK